MSNGEHTLEIRLSDSFHVLSAHSANNQFANITIPQHPKMADNNYGSPHQDSWCSESVSLDGPTSPNLDLIGLYNPYGYTPNMVCVTEKNNLMVGVALDYTNLQFWVVAFNFNSDGDQLQIISATQSGPSRANSFGGGYFFLDADDNVVTVEHRDKVNNCIVCYPTKHLDLSQYLEITQEMIIKQQQDEQDLLDGKVITAPYQPASHQAITPSWISGDIVAAVYAFMGEDDDSADNSLYSCLPVWHSEQDVLRYWCLLSGSYNYSAATSERTLSACAYMAVVEITPTGQGQCMTECISAYKLDGQWNNNTFAVDKNGAYIVTNGLHKNDDGSYDPQRCDEGYLWAFTLNDDNVICLKWQPAAYKNAGYLKPGQTNIGSGTTPTLTSRFNNDSTDYIAIVDNADPKMNVVVYDSHTGFKISETPCFEDMRSADEASLIGVQNTFIAENNFGHYDTYPANLCAPNGLGMELIRLGSADSDSRKIAATPIWTIPDVHFYAMNMLCRHSGIIFAHTCDWDVANSASHGGMYYVSAIDSYNGRVIWRIPLGQGNHYCHEYGGIYFNSTNDLFIGTNRYLFCIRNHQLGELTQH